MVKRGVRLLLLITVLIILSQVITAVLWQRAMQTKPPRVESPASRLEAFHRLDLGMSGETTDQILAEYHAQPREHIPYGKWRWLVGAVLPGTRWEASFRDGDIGYTVASGRLSNLEIIFGPPNPNKATDPASRLANILKKADPEACRAHFSLIAAEFYRIHGPAARQGSNCFSWYATWAVRNGMVSLETLPHSCLVVVRKDRTASFTTNYHDEGVTPGSCEKGQS